MYLFIYIFFERKIKPPIIVCESFESGIFKHLSRDFNAVAHELAQLARRTESSCMWKGVSPSEVSRLVQKDLLALD